MKQKSSHTPTRIVFRVWHKQKSVCDGKNHFREDVEGSHWFEKCEYIDPIVSHRNLEDKLWKCEHPWKNVISEYDEMRCLKCDTVLRKVYKAIAKAEDSL